MDHAIPYAKLVLLAGIGAISQESLLACIGSYSVLPRGPAIDFRGIGRVTSNLDAKYWQSGSSPWSFSVSGNLAEFNVFITVRLIDQNASPLGIRRLDSITESNVEEAVNRTHVAVTADSDKYALASAGGLLLMAEATDDSAQGAIFGLLLQNENGEPYSRYPIVPFKVE